MRRRTDLQSAQPFDLARLASREKWGLPLTPAEQRALDEWRITSWVPQWALHYMWAHVDPIHGCGGDQRSQGCPWSWSAISKAIAADRVEIDHLTSMHPEQADRLRQWVSDVETLAHDRNGDPRRERLGEFYERLRALGYDGTRREANEEPGE